MTMKQRILPNLTIFNQSCLKTRLRHLARASASCEFIQILQFLLVDFFLVVFQIWYLMVTNVQTLCTMRIIGSYTFQPLWVSDISIDCGRPHHLVKLVNVLVLYHDVLISPRNCPLEMLFKVILGS